MPIMGAAALWLLFKSVQGEIGLLAALAGFLALVVLYALSVWSKSMVVAGSVAIALVAGMAFFPFAVTQLERVELGEIDIDRLDKAHRAVSERPDNWSAWFELSRALHDFGLVSHAVAIAESTLARLSTERDPLTQRSTYDLFSTEQREVAKWRRETRPGRQTLAKCLQCGHDNPPGEIACGRCKGPYLLELARRAKVRPVVYGKFAIGYAGVAFAVAASAWAGVSLEWPASVGVILGVLALAGLVLAVLFRPKQTY
jgi:hypothetical protein